MNKLDLNLLRCALAVAKPFWVSPERRRAWGLVVLLVILLLADTQLNVYFNKQSGEFTSALAAQDGARFWRSIRAFLLLVVVAVPLYAWYYYVRDKLSLDWRSWLTSRFLSGYFANHAFYHLLARPEIDDPDQRIADDIAGFTTQSVSFLLLLLGGVFQLVAFSSVLWSISSYLVLFLLLYAVVGTLIAFGVFGEKMVQLYFNQRRREADFRFGLVRIRENAEAIALYHGEQKEQAQVEKLFGEVYANFYRLIQWSLRLNFFQYSHSLLTMVIPSVIIAPRVLSGELEVGRVVQAEGAFAAILAALTLLMGYLENLSRFAAGVGRLDSLAASLQATRTGKFPGRERIVTQQGLSVGLEGITLLTPNYERILVKDLTVSVSPGQHLMIVGASGLGKSSLLRMIAGLWDAGAGTVLRPCSADILFLPQHAYMIPGSLRQQLSYPALSREVSETEFQTVLEKVNLPDLVARCGGFDTELDFGKVLSVGERQRLAFARVLLTRPRYVLLDEATSALDQENESALYRLLRDMETTLVSVSHRRALVQYHAQVLELKPDGRWDLHPAAGFRFTEELA